MSTRPDDLAPAASPPARTDLPDEVYPDDPWSIVEERFAPRFLYLTETIFALSNGHVGLRAALDEGTSGHAPGTFVNGFHETWPIIHPEAAYGYADVGQTIVNVPDASPIEVEVDGEGLDPALATTFRRSLDFREGILERVVEWQTGAGTAVRMWSRRLVSLTHRELMSFSVRVETDRPADVVIRSHLVNRQDAPDSRTPDGDPRRAARLHHRVLEPRAATVDGTRLIQTWVTANSGMGLVTAVDHRLAGAEAAVHHSRTADDFGFHLSFRTDGGAPVELTKHAVYLTSPAQPAVEHRQFAADALDRAIELGFDGLAKAQHRALAAFWEVADVQVDAGREVQRAIRWSLFQLHQASAFLDGLSIPAKGLTGQAYDGHYFWDTEIYVLPFLIYTSPARAREILRFRHGLLPHARRRAEQLKLRGALFPWRTITGEEASAYFPAGTAQFHIDADIVYAVRKYVRATGDREFLWEHGLELVVETARMWHDLGFYRTGRFHIHGVTGPDEYTALVNDNAYTNAMARMNLRFASEVVEGLAVEDPARFAVAAAGLGLDPGEARRWRLAGDDIYIPYDLELGITAQDDQFLTLEPWDFEGTPASQRPLLLHFHPLSIYRFQVLKQADVVLVDFLLGDEFADELKRTNFRYYDPITTGDSSLSACVQSIMAAEIGDLRLAETYFDHAAFMDLADLAGNTTDGVHMASAGGVWLALIYGFAGFRDHGGRLAFDPTLPASWQRLRFRLRWHGTTLDIDIDHHRIELTSEAGVPLEVRVGGVDHEIPGAGTLAVPLAVNTTG